MMKFQSEQDAASLDSAVYTRVLDPREINDPFMTEKSTDLMREITNDYKRVVGEQRMKFRERLQGCHGSGCMG